MFCEYGIRSRGKNCVIGTTIEIHFELSMWQYTFTADKVRVYLILPEQKHAATTYTIVSETCRSQGFDPTSPRIYRNSRPAGEAICGCICELPWRN